MRKLILIFATLFFCALGFADDAKPGSRLYDLVQKKVALQAAGQDLGASDADEFAKLAAANGIVGTAELEQKAKAQLAASRAQAAAPQPAPQALTQEQAYQNHQKGVVIPGQAEKNLLAVRDQAPATPSPMPAQKAIDPKSVSGTDMAEQRSLGADSVAAAAAAPPRPKKEKKKETVDTIDPTYAKRMKKEGADMSAIRKDADELKRPAGQAPAASARPGAIYDPVLSEPGVRQPGFVIDRDSSTIITKRVGTKDAVTIKMCVAYGVSIILDESIDTELQRVILDDKIFFDAQSFENNRGVYVKLTKPIPDGNRWDSAIRLVRKSDDKTYLVNLIGVPCPDGNVDYPRVVYLKEKSEVLAVRQSEVMTPEDMIIQASQGLPRKNLHEVKVYDMVTRPGSSSVLFGVEIQGAAIEKPEKIEFAVLDSLQISKVQSKSDFMKLQSDKATELRGQASYRYKVSVSIDKDYILRNRFVHLVYINKETKHYQYVQVDVLQYFKSLKDRGFDL